MNLRTTIVRIAKVAGYLTVGLFCLRQAIHQTADQPSSWALMIACSICFLRAVKLTWEKRSGA